MGRYPYSCRDGYCGAYDCATCRPGNEYWREWQDEQDKHDDMAADNAMEQRKAEIEEGAAK
jgi:hypothetical protein